jgi:hypothetical protein
MPEVVDTRHLPDLNTREWYVLEDDGDYYTKYEALMTTGEVLKNITICRFKDTVKRLVEERGCKYIGVGFHHV